MRYHNFLNEIFLWLAKIKRNSNENENWLRCRRAKKPFYVSCAHFCSSVRWFQCEFVLRINISSLFLLFSKQLEIVNKMQISQMKTLNRIIRKAKSQLILFYFVNYIFYYIFNVSINPAIPWLLLSFDSYRWYASHKIPPKTWISTRARAHTQR